MVFAYAQENNAMSLELEYRNRLHEVAREVKKRLVCEFILQFRQSENMCLKPLLVNTREVVEV